MTGCALRWPLKQAHAAAIMPSRRPFLVTCEHACDDKDRNQIEQDAAKAQLTLPRGTTRACASQEADSIAYAERMQSTHQPLTSTNTAVKDRSLSSMSAASPMPLSAVVQLCMRHWYTSTLTEAQCGQAESMLALSQMLYSGYGCKMDKGLAHEWAAKGRRLLGLDRPG